MINPVIALNMKIIDSISSAWIPDDDFLLKNSIQVRVKPETAEVELEMSVQVDSENYDADADDVKAMPKQVFSSAWKPLTSARYAVGILIGNELHLNPVHAVVQLRPSMQLLKRHHPSKERTPSADIKKEKVVKQSQKQVTYHGFMKVLFIGERLIVCLVEDYT